MSLKKIGNTYHLRRRVPKRFRPVELRELISQSLHTVSAQLAKLKADAAWAELIEGSEARLVGDTEDAERRFEAAQELAERLGFRFLPAAKVAELPTTALLDRIEKVQEHKGEPNMVEAAALFGGVSETPIRVTRALELYWGLAKETTLGKSEDQLRRWQNPRKKAVKKFVDVVGDRPVPEIAGDDMLTFRDWWIDRIAEENMTPDSANKDLIHLGAMRLSVRRARISVDSEEALLSDETLRENIVLGQQVSEQALNDALEAAHVTDFLPRLEDGLETRVESRGSNQSGGQRQRVSIARALLAARHARAAAGRGDQRAGRAIRGRLAGCAGETERGAHHAGLRTPVGHSTRRRQNRGDGRRPRRRGRPPRGADRTRWSLPRPIPAAIRGRRDRVIAPGAS